jgi:uncharacterized protein (TIGR02145 family)
MPKAHLFSYRLPEVETKAVARIKFISSWYADSFISATVSTPDPTYGNIVLGTANFVPTLNYLDNLANVLVSSIRGGIYGGIYGYTASKVTSTPNRAQVTIDFNPYSSFLGAFGVTNFFSLIVNDPRVGNITLHNTSGSGTTFQDVLNSYVNYIDNNNVYGYSATTSGGFITILAPLVLGSSINGNVASWSLTIGNSYFYAGLPTFEGGSDSIYVDVTSRPGLGESNNDVQLTSQFNFDGGIINPIQSFTGGVSANVLGCEQIGTMSVSLETTDTIGFSVGNMGNPYHGPDEDLGYVIAYSSPYDGIRTHLRGTELVPPPGAVGFIRSDGLTYSSFVSLVNDRLGGTYSSDSIGAMVAKYRLNTNGYWTSFPNLWMTRNLDVATYSNGVAIPQVTDLVTWESLTTGAWCYYDFDPANGPIYGKLYNWYAVSDSRGLAPTGYHIPTNAEMTTLKSYLDPLAGGHMKESGLVHWSFTSESDDNSSEFTALGSGYLDPIEGSIDIRGSFNCWTSGEVDAENAYYFNIGKLSRGRRSSNLFIDESPKNYGYSVRCLKNF